MKECIGAAYKPKPTFLAGSAGCRPRLVSVVAGRAGEAGGAPGEAGGEGAE